MLKYFKVLSFTSMAGGLLKCKMAFKIFHNKETPDNPSNFFFGFSQEKNTWRLWFSPGAPAGDKKTDALVKRLDRTAL